MKHYWGDFMKNKLAIFDFDGTLFDTKDCNYNSYRQALEECGFKLDYDYFCNECFGKNYKEFLKDIISFDKDYIMEKVHNRKKELYYEYLSEVSMNKGLFSIIDSIKNEYYISLVTNASYSNCNAVLEHFNVKDKFDYIVTQEDVENLKPNSEGLIKAINHFGISVDETIVFEDSNVGVEAAKTCGFRCLMCV